MKKTTLWRNNAAPAGPSDKSSSGSTASGSSKTGTTPVAAATASAKPVAPKTKSSSGSNPSTAAPHSTNRGSLNNNQEKRRSISNAPTDGEDKLPPGWTRKESKSQKGRYYYISPAGKTQWVPPPSAKTPSAKIKKTYNWLSEVEICFQEGRLGVSLREVHQMETILYPQFQAEVDDLPKVNGKAGPAELHNWSVKANKRLTIGMRVISIEDASLVGFTYKEVVAKLKTASRPVRIKFADVQKGTVEENGGRKSDGDSAKNSTATDLAGPGYGHSTAYMQQKQEYTRVLVTGELYTEMWTIENKKLLRSLTRMQHKWNTVSSEFDILNARRMELRKENDEMKSDKEKYEKMLKNLKLQATHAMENPELVRANELAKRNTELSDDISKMSSGNKRLRKERDALQAQLDELEKQLVKVEQKDKAEEEDRVPEEDIFGIEPTAPPKEQLSALKKKRRGLEDEVNKEQRKANKVQKEMEQLTKHYASLENEESGHISSTSSPSSHHPPKDDKDKNASTPSGQHDTTSSGGNGVTKPKSEFADLEAKILELRKKQRSVVDTLSKAAQSGDHKLAKECQRRRQKIKEELKDAQDELYRVKNHGKQEASSARGERSRKEKTSVEAVTVPSRQHSPSSKKSKQLGSISKGKLSPSTPDASADTPSTTGSSRAGKMPMLSGFLEKGPTEWADRGLISGMKTMRGARERWCVITADGFLKYYKRRGDSVVRGEINLAEKSFEVLADDLAHGKEFVLSTDEQQSHFFTKNAQELNNWVKTLRAANAYLLNAAAPPLPPPRAARGTGGKQVSARHETKQTQEFNLDGLEDSLPEEDEQFYGRATLGF